MPRVSEGRRPRILIVEDDPLVLELVTTRLELAGFHTSYARKGREGLGRIQDLRPDGLVLDINMPVMDGFAILSHLKSAGSFYPPTLVLTARNKPEDVKTAIALGARDFLAKPFKDHQLIARVGRLVRMPASSPGSAMRPAGQGDLKRPNSAFDDGWVSFGPLHSGHRTIEI
jgi:DNA-binding response OmpR family regulator